jgi:hypothetical protein
MQWLERRTKALARRLRTRRRKTRVVTKFLKNRRRSYYNPW